MKQVEITDQQFIAEWQSMLQIFYGLIENNPPVEKIKSDLLELKQAALDTIYLTEAQRRGISERVDNYINGTYGRNLSHNQTDKK